MSNPSNRGEIRGDPDRGSDCLYCTTYIPFGVEVCRKCHKKVGQVNFYKPGIQEMHLAQETQRIRAEQEAKAADWLAKQPRKRGR